jgi:hypothetical protein
MSVFELVIYSFEEKQRGQFALQDSVLLPLRHLGILHENKGVAPAHYEVVNLLVLEGLQHSFGNEFTPEIKTAWSLALGHLSAAMLNKKLKPTDKSSVESGNSLRETFNTIYDWQTETPSISSASSFALSADINH